MPNLILKDDDPVFAEIYQRCKGIFFLHAYKMPGGREEAKDVLQGLFTTGKCFARKLVFGIYEITACRYSDE